MCRGWLGLPRSPVWAIQAGRSGPATGPSRPPAVLGPTGGDRSAYYARQLRESCGPSGTIGSFRPVDPDATHRRAASGALATWLAAQGPALCAGAAAHGEVDGITALCAQTVRGVNYKLDLSATVTCAPSAAAPAPDSGSPGGGAAAPAETTIPVTLRAFVYQPLPGPVLVGGAPLVADPEVRAVALLVAGGVAGDGPAPGPAPAPGAPGAGGRPCPAGQAYRCAEVQCFAAPCPPVCGCA